MLHYQLFTMKIHKTSPLAWVTAAVQGLAKRQYESGWKDDIHSIVLIYVFPLNYSDLVDFISTEVGAW